MALVGVLLLFCCFTFASSVNVSTDGEDSTTCSECRTLYGAAKSVFGSDGEISGNLTVTLRRGSYEDEIGLNFSGLLKVQGQLSPSDCTLSKGSAIERPLFQLIAANSSLWVGYLTWLIKDYSNPYLIYTSIGANITMYYSRIKQAEGIKSIVGNIFYLANGTSGFTFEAVFVENINTIDGNSLFIGGSVCYVSKFRLLESSFTNFSGSVTYGAMRGGSFNMTGCTITNQRPSFESDYGYEMIKFGLGPNKDDVIQNCKFVNASRAINVYTDPGKTGEIILSNDSFTSGTYHMFVGNGTYNQYLTSRFSNCSFVNITEFPTATIMVYYGKAYFERCVFSTLFRPICLRNCTARIVSSVFCNNTVNSRDAPSLDIQAYNSAITIIDTYTTPRGSTNGSEPEYNNCTVSGSMFDSSRLCYSTVTGGRIFAFEFFCPGQVKGGEEGVDGEAKNKFPIAALISIIVVGVVVIALGVVVIVLVQKRRNKRKDSSNDEQVNMREADETLRQRQVELRETEQSENESV